jgi:hypothetical protein
LVNEAAGEKTPEAYPLGYVEDFFELRTKLGNSPDIPEPDQNDLS